MERAFFSSRFERLIKTVYQQTGKQAVILVDEYDKPLLQTMGVNEPLNEQYRNTLKAFYSVIEKHPFLDGNKRIGVHLMLIFLKINGIDLNDSQEELIDFGLKIASGKMKKDEINVILAALQSNKEV